MTKRPKPDPCRTAAEFLKLLARHAFCINYLCHDLNLNLTTDQKNDLSTLSGLEIFKGWELEQRIHRLFLVK